MEGGEGEAEGEEGGAEGAGKGVEEMEEGGGGPVVLGTFLTPSHHLASAGAASTDT